MRGSSRLSPNPPRSSMRVVSAVIVAALLVVVSACEYRSDAIRVENRSSQTVNLFTEFDEATRTDHGTLRPGEGFVDRLECIEIDFVAESLDGEELARRPGPFCQGDPPWILTDELLSGN